MDGATARAHEPFPPCKGDPMIPFSQVDVFSADPFRGNPVAVFHCDGPGVTPPDDELMAAIATWTNLSETTFLLPPTDPGADYRVRIFTPSQEFPFAGHPTLGSARAWLDAGGVPANRGSVVQECGIGLVEVRVGGEQPGERLAFAAPDFLRTGEVDRTTTARVLDVLGVDRRQVQEMRWIDNGPGWLGVLLNSAADVLAIELDPSRLTDPAIEDPELRELKLGVFGRHPASSGDAHSAQPDAEVRAFAPGVAEDPVTGSLNAGFAAWLIGDGLMPEHYIAAQGQRIGRNGRIHLGADGDRIWVGGRAKVILSGQARIG